MLCILCTGHVFLLALQHSSSGKAAPALPGLLQALQEGLASYQATWQQLLQEDTEQSRQPGAVPEQQDCPDLHEKCPFWAAVVSSLHEVAGMLVLHNPGSRCSGCLARIPVVCGGCSMTA